VSWSAIAQIETGRRKDVRLSSVSAMATALGVSIDALIGVSPWVPPRLLDHRVLLYDSDDAFLAGASPFLTGGVRRSERVLAVIIDAHTALLKGALGAEAREVQFADASDWYRTPLTAVANYRRFLGAHGHSAGLCILAEVECRGEWSPPERRAWTRYESLFNMTFAGVPATIICAYDTRTLDHRLADVRRTHPVLQLADGTVVVSDSYLEPELLLLEIE
jgi:hypothetical protein